ncbi:DUF1501 domain-containing protein, partial [Akkermansiaceae bacterium]|nr:DUF1501 domain-containing protein [Akkermansiaceae bacterium]
MLSKEKHSNRRKFIGDISCAGVGSTAALSSLLNLKLAGSLAAADGQAETDYRALVCVFLGGGNDSFNMLAPYSGDQRVIYEETRGEIGYPLEDFSSLSGHGPGDTKLGLHKNMPNLKALYESGKASFISNVGTLIEPATVAGIQANTVKLPLGLFSHSDQSLHWQSGMPETRNPGSGWGGRMADMLDDLNEVSRISMNISLAGINLYQSGVQTTVLSKASGTIPGITDWSRPGYLPRRKVTSDMMEAQYQSIFERAFAAQMKDAIGASEDYRSALESTAPLEAIFTTDNSLSMQLKDVAEGIAAHENLGKCRQTFFVMAGGWDHHASLDPHPEMLAMLDKAIGEF